MLTVNKKYLLPLVWVIFITVTIALYSANHFYEKGPMFDTGDVVCLYDGRGPCKEDYIEDPRYLNVPEWVKFFKRSEGQLLWMASLFVLIMVSYKE